MHPIDEIMEERCPNLMRNKIFWSFIKPSIYKIFKYEEAKKIVDDIINKPGFECFTYLTEFLKAENQVTNLSNVPSSGPIILAGNHPTGLTDGLIKDQKILFLIRFGHLSSIISSIGCI